MNFLTPQPVEMPVFCCRPLSGEHGPRSEASLDAFLVAATLEVARQDSIGKASAGEEGNLKHQVVLPKVISQIPVEAVLYL